MSALLDQLHQRHPAEVNLAFEQAVTASAGVWLEQLSASLAALTFSDREAAGAGRASLPPERCAPLMTEALRRYFSHKSDDQLQRMSSLMVWTANGVLEGARHRADLSAHDAGCGLLAAWRGIMRSWNPKI